MRPQIGKAPCVCGYYITAMIDADSKESDGEDGFWYNVISGGECPDCGEPLRYLHESSQAMMELMTRREMVEVST